MMSRMINVLIHKYWKQAKASMLATFAIVLPVVIGAAGVALDISEAYLVRQRLSAALDSSALAAAAMETEEAEISARVADFFAANYPEDKIGTTYDLNTTVDGDNVTVSAKADFNTSFMHLFGYDKITVASRTTVTREVQGLEVALVLDNTGSMSSNNNIDALRTASHNFVQIMFDRASDPEDIKIGLVPYSSSVRIGTYGFGEYPDGSPYGGGDSFIVDENGIDIDPSRYTTNYNARKTDSDNWYGCIIEANADGWDEAISNNDPYPLDVNDHAGPWEIYAYGDYQQSCTGWGWYRTCTNTGWDVNTYPNRNCPRTQIVPLSSDEQGLYDAISTMQAGGYTYGNVGMEWGYRLLSPEAPFQEGQSWTNPAWRKAIIMMTDGNNTMEQNYSYYWRTDNHNIGVNDLNNRFAEVCTMLKDQGVLVYTVTFTSNINSSTKDYYRNCASSSAQYFDAPSQADLISVFETISKQLANLHISS